MPAVTPASDADRAQLGALHTRAAAVDGHPSLGEAVWRDLDRPGPDSQGFASRGGGTLDGYAHVARHDTFAAPHWVIGLVTDPEARDELRAADLLAAAVDHVARRGGGRAVLWRFAPTRHDDAVAAAAGFHAERDLFQMRAPLPPADEPRLPPGVTCRTFRPDDEADRRAWLAVNNRAFRNHPEQDGWVEATLRRRMAEPWFDPSLFLLAFDAAGLAGFNWLKVHEGHGRDPDLGEIFVIGVDPDRQGTGLGRALALEGLHLLARRGLRTAMLFVAADNEAAVALYRDLGFTVHRLDRAYARDVEAAA